MGLILDSSILVAAERKGHTVSHLLEALKGGFVGEELGLSAMTVAELMHGVVRAKDEVHRERRAAFLDRLCLDIPVYALTLELAKLIGQIEGEQAAIGNVLPFQDLVIGATALMLGFDVLTSNVRHFRRIPGLTVVVP